MGAFGDYFGVDASSTSSVLQLASSSELLVLTEALSKIEEHIARLRLHLRVNDHAVSKICAKVINAGDAEKGHAHQARWVNARRARTAQLPEGLAEADFLEHHGEKRMECCIC